MLASVEVPAGFDVVTGTDRAIDPIGNPPEAAAALAAAAEAEAGAAICSPAVVSKSLDHYLEQLEALAS